MERENDLEQKLKASEGSNEAGHVEEEQDWTFSYMENEAGVSKETIEKATESKEGEKRLIDQTENAAVKKTETVKEQSEIISREVASADLPDHQAQEITQEVSLINAEIEEAKTTLEKEIASSQVEGENTTEAVGAEEAEKQFEANEKAIADILKVVEPINRLEGWGKRFEREIDLWESLATIKKSINSYIPKSTLDKNQVSAAWGNLVNEISSTSRRASGSGFKDRVSYIQTELERKNLPDQDQVNEALDKIATALEADGMTSVDAGVDTNNVLAMENKSKTLVSEKDETVKELEDLRSKMQEGQETNLRSELQKLQSENEKLAQEIPKEESQPE